MKRTPLARKTPLKSKTAPKRSRLKSTPARQAAQGKPCMIRLPGCDGGGATTVAAHYRLAGYCGAGIKPDDDIFVAWACHHCHAVVDGRIFAPPGYFRSDVRLAHAEGCLRTMAARIAP
ncbi:MAG: nuclease domain-containing protein [Acidobacteriaceae bacterium]